MISFPLFNLLGTFLLAWTVYAIWNACQCRAADQSVSTVLLGESRDVSNYVGTGVILYAQFGEAIVLMRQNVMSAAAQSNLLFQSCEYGALSMAIAALIGTLLFFTVECAKRVGVGRTTL